MTRALAQTLIDLNPTGLDRVRRTQRPSDVVRPNVGSKPIVAVVGHADRVGLVGPRNGDEHWAKNLLASKAPVVCYVREDSRDRVITLAERSLLGRETADYEARFASLKPFLDITAHFVELLFIDDGADVACLIERIAELKCLHFPPERIEKVLEDVAMKEE